MTDKDRCEGGSITVFMTFLFLLLFALTGTVLDSARFFGSGGYMKVSSYGAAVAVYGDYNRELFREYALFGYGGYNGIGETDWTEEFEQVLIKNLTERPTEQNPSLQGLFSKKYASVYQLGAVSVNLDDTDFLIQEEQFMRQLKAWAKAAAVRDITDKLLEWIKGTDSKNQTDLLDSVEETAQLESKKLQQEKKSPDNSGGEDGSQQVLKEEEETYDEEDGKRQDENKGSGKNTGISSAKSQNPLEYLRKLMRNGVLSLVCDEDSLAESEVHIRATREKDGDMAEKNQKEKTESNEKWHQQGTGTGILKGLLKQSDSLWDDEMFCSQNKKGVLLLYASHMFGSYLSGKGRTQPYGLEYLVTGKRNQKDAIAAVVNRLFFIRTLLNYIYVSGEPVLQQKSLATATAIAAPFAAEAFIPVIQQSILLVFSLEEACVDITALLQGKIVPIMKNQTNFKMRYEELCAASPVIFHRRAAVYPEAGKGVALKDFSRGIGYIHYLWLMLLMTSWDNLYQRSLDLIQDDLREKYNHSFDIGSCICQTKATVTYGMPLLSAVFLVKGAEDAVDKDKMAQGMVVRKTEISYGYQ